MHEDAPGGRRRCSGLSPPALGERLLRIECDIQRLRLCRYAGGVLRGGLSCYVLLLPKLSGDAASGDERARPACHAFP